jgi:hypothetical protein
MVVMKQVKEGDDNEEKIKISAWCKSLPEKTPVAQQLKKFHATGPYSEPDESSL